MFMLPLSRTEILKRWGATLFLAVLKYWSAFVLPFSLVTLFAGTGGGMQIPLPTLLIATVAAQLPLFGIATLLLSFKMAVGLRYNILTVLLLGIPRFSRLQVTSSKRIRRSWPPFWLVRS